MSRPDLNLPLLLHALDDHVRTDLINHHFLVLCSALSLTHSFGDIDKPQVVQTSSPVSAPR